MRAIKYRELKRLFEAEGAVKTCRHLGAALEAKELKPEDFSLREIAEVTLGAERVKAMDPRQGSVILEAGDGVDVTAFSNITGQLIYFRIMEAYQNPGFWASGLIPNIPTRLSGERIPGIGKITDNTPTVSEGMPYENFGFGEDYQDTPVTTKRGFIVPVTKEAIFFDRTGLILSRAAEVGEILGLNKEKRLLDLLLGVTNNYNWKGTAYNSYVSTPWANALTNTLVDWTDVEEAEMLFAAMTDPNTGEPIILNAGAVKFIVMPANGHRAKAILHATEVDYGIPSSETVQTITKSLNTLNQYPLIGGGISETALLQARLVASGVSASDAKKYWFLGDPAKAFAYMENWPITVVQAPANSEAEFNQDIVARYKASERGAAAVMNPRYMVKSTGAA